MCPLDTKVYATVVAKLLHASVTKEKHFKKLNGLDGPNEQDVKTLSPMLLQLLLIRLILMGIVLRDKTRAHSQGDVSLGKLGPAQPNLQPAVSMTAELPGFKEQS